MDIRLVRASRIILFTLGSAVILGGYQNCGKMNVDQKSFSGQSVQLIEMQKRRDTSPSPTPSVASLGVTRPQLSATTVVAGQNLSITYNWTGGPSSVPLRAFVHFLDINNNITFQDDHTPLVDTTNWSTSQSYTRDILVPSAVSGTFKIAVGLYDTTTGTRQTLVYSAGIVDLGQFRYQVATIGVTAVVAEIAPTPTLSPAPTPIVETQIVYSKPIIITVGGTYSGNWESLDPAIAAVNVRTSEPVIIQNCNIRSKGMSIKAAWTRANLTVMNCRALGLNPNVLNANHGRFLHAEGFESIVVKNNSLEKTGGIYLHDWYGGPTTKISVTQNYAKNIEGRSSDGNGGYLANAFMRYQFLQFNKVLNHPNVDISWNKIVNLPRESWVEDVINMYGSTGTSASPINIHDNLIDGAFRGDPAGMYSGGGIMMGDGNCGDGYVTAQNNTILETSNYGVAVAGGNNQKILNNTILGLGKLADGTFLDSDSDAGIYLRDYCSSASHDASTVYATGNTVGWGTPSASNPNGRWDVSANVAVALLANVSNAIIAPGPIDPALLTSARNAWTAKAAGKQIGSN